MPLDEADKKAIAEMLAAAMGASSEEQSKRTAASIKAAVDALGIDAKLEALKVKPDAVEDKVEDKKGGKVSPEMMRLQKQLETLTRQSGEDRTAREAAELKAKTSTLLSAFDNAARKAGVPAERLPALRALLHNASERVKYDDNDRPGLHFQRDGYDEVLDLETGFGEYLGTSEGKQFMPPSKIAGTGESGSRGGGRMTGTDGKFNRDAAGSALLGASRSIS
jgi:hypothetical protein